MMQLALALVVLLNAAISLEDPFDNVGLDGIYIDEAWSDVQQVGLAVGCMSLHSQHVQRQMSRGHTAGHDGR